MDREVVGVCAVALLACGLSWLYEELVAAVSAAAALCALFVFGWLGFLSKSNDVKLTVVRKLPHVVGGLLVSVFVLVDARWLAVGLTAAATFGYLLLMVGRPVLGWGAVSQVAARFGLITGGGASHRYLSSTFYGFSAIALLLLMFYPVAAAGGILVLTLSDSVAALVGVRGRHRIASLNKTFEGSAAMFLCSVAVLFALGVPAYLALLVALVATVVEALPLPVDDNFLIPMVVGLLLEAFAL